MSRDVLLLNAGSLDRCEEFLGLFSERGARGGREPASNSSATAFIEQQGSLLDSQKINTESTQIQSM